MRSKNRFQEIPAGWKFLITVVLLYLFVAVFDFDFARIAFLQFAETFFKVVKILLFVFGFMFIVNLFVKTETIQKHLGKDSGAKGWFYAIAGSIFVSGPPYVLFPFLGELKKQGVKDSLLVAFLNNRNVNPTFLPVMIFYFGTAFSVIVSIYVLLFSFINGWIMGKLLDGKAD
ncbi:permease [bacterium]|jgi:uncharacterized membrane protein YraQ (UPF0718 family)|nr:permease [bacterium]MBT4250792.1 permease [bacterium]MBT4598235.1 permease [bacterium]MBT6753834.1 permease [bacterium]MBT7037454.1 permease [bacterium]